MSDVSNTKLRAPPADKCGLRSRVPIKYKLILLVRLQGVSSLWDGPVDWHGGQGIVAGRLQQHRQVGLTLLRERKHALCLLLNHLALCVLRLHFLFAGEQASILHLKLFDL